MKQEEILKDNKSQRVFCSVFLSNGKKCNLPLEKFVEELKKLNKKYPNYAIEAVEQRKSTESICDILLFNIVAS